MIVYTAVGTLAFLIPQQDLAKFASNLRMLDATEVEQPLVEETKVEDPPRPKIEEYANCPSMAIDTDIVEIALAAMVNPANKGKFIAWTNDYGNESKNPDNVQVVYVYQGIRYTLWYKPTEVTTVEVLGQTHEVVQKDFVSVWERPNGSRGDAVLDTYTDFGVDGCVNFGIGGEKSRGEGGQKMYWNFGPSPDLPEFHTNFQRSYLEAIAGLVSVLDLH